MTEPSKKAEEIARDWCANTLDHDETKEIRRACARQIQAAMDEARDCARAEKACIANHLGSPCGSCFHEGRLSEWQAILEEFHKFTQREGWNFAGEFIAWVEARNKGEST